MKQNQAPEAQEIHDSKSLQKQQPGINVCSTHTEKTVQERNEAALKLPERSSFIIFKLIKWFMKGFAISTWIKY